MLTVQKEHQFQPGLITYFYESGKRNLLADVGVISSGLHDPGGKSYGIYQLSSRAGTLERFIKFFNEKYEKYFVDKFYLNLFNGLVLATDEFDKKWRLLATQATQAFANMQRAFIAEIHFKPLMQHLHENNIPQGKITPAVQEALWSLGVQHGNAKLILQKALDELKTIIDEQTFIKCLYKYRSAYVMQLTTLNSQMKENICARYVKECAEIIVTLIKPI